LFLREDDPLNGHRGGEVRSSVVEFRFLRMIVTIVSANIAEFLNP
jgi:hypothetical protein